MSVDASPGTSNRSTLGLFPWAMFGYAASSDTSAGGPFVRLVVKLEAASARYRRPTFGANVAVLSALEAILRYGGGARYDVFVDPRCMRSTLEALSPILGARSGHLPKLDVQPFTSLMRRLPNLEFSAWFSPSPMLGLLCYLRRLRSMRLFPVTVLHHTISYQSFLSAFGLPALLSDLYPCDSVICTTRAARSALQNLVEHVSTGLGTRVGGDLRYKGRLDLIPLGVNTNHFRPREKPLVRRKLHLPQNAFVLLYVGRFSPSDKMDLFPLLRVFADLVREKPRSEPVLVLAGGRASPNGCYGTPIYLGALTDYARSLGIYKNIQILPMAQNAELLYSAADVFLSPCDNLQESFGIAVVEAMASGVPQVVADWNGYRDTVSHGETGFLIPTHWANCDNDVCDTSPLFLGDPEIDHVTLAQSVALDMGRCKEYLLKLIDNAELRQTMGRNSRERALALYDWPVIVMQYEALWDELARYAKGHAFRQDYNLSYIRPAYVKCFGHYASHLLGDETQLRATHEGQRRALSMARGLIPTRHIAKEYGLLDEDLLRRILLAVSQNLTHAGAGSQGDVPPRGCGFVTLRNLIEQDLAGLGHDGRPSLLRHILWLIKYGLLEVSEREV
jgi:D-inositol-3-phosphate glycosyltransferase